MPGERFSYPYYDPLFSGELKPITPRLTEEIASLSGAVVEVAGPSIHGYSLLKNNKIFGSRPIITNLINWSDEKIEAIADGAHLPFATHSVSVFLANHISITNYKDMEGKSAKRQLMVHAAAIDEYEQALADPDFEATYNLRIKILKEMSATITPGGFIIFEAMNAQDIIYATSLGFTSEYLQIRGSMEDTWNDCVFKKIAA